MDIVHTGGAANCQCDTSAGNMQVFKDGLPEHSAFCSLQERVQDTIVRGLLTLLDVMNRLERHGPRGRQPMQCKIANLWGQ